jgi:hypothetical protein
VSTLGDEDVGRLDINMNDPRRMGRIERVSDLDRKRHQQIDFKRTSGDALLQHHAIQKLHGNERLLAMPADFVDGADVGVVEGGSGACFAPETLERLRVTSNFFGQKLQGDKATKFRVLRFIDHAHTAAPELLDDAVVRDGLANHLRESYVCERGKSMKAEVLAESQNGGW